MSDEKETIADIVADIRAQNQGLPEDGYALSPMICELLSIADRIEAAYNSEREAREVARRDIDTVICRYGRLVKKLRSENERLLSALKPVQDAYIPDFSICDTCYDRSECKGHEYNLKCEWYDIVESVRESQRIYKGGAK